MSYFNFFLFPFIATIRLFERAKGLIQKEVISDKTEFSLNKPGVVNNLLTNIFSFESKLLKKFYLPFGVSIVCILKKS